MVTGRTWLAREQAATVTPAVRPLLPRVSVVIPCHNYARFLDEAVDSALSQEGVEVDVTIVDDASTDGSLELARRWADRDSRVHVIAHHTNLGHIATFNEALDSATAPFVVKLDPDDVLPEGTLRRSADALLDREDAVFVYGHVLTFDGDTPVPLPRAVRSVKVWSGERWLWWRAHRVRNVIYQPEIMIRRSALERVGGHRDDVPAASDFNLWLRLAATGSVARIAGPVQGLMRKHPESMQTTVHAGKLVDFRARVLAFELFLEEAGGSLRDESRFRRHVAKALSRDAIRLAFEEFEDERDPTDYLADAKRLWRGITRTIRWRSIHRQIRAGGPTWWGWFGRRKRDLDARLRWRLWCRFGI